MSKRISIGLAALFACTLVLAQAVGPVSTRLRGTVERMDAGSLVVKDRTGASVAFALADNFSVNEVMPIALGAIQPGSYIGTAAMPNADGTLGALAITVFPEAARGTGEGHGPWDLQPGSTMTNGTVGNVLVTGAQGRTLTMKYKDGEKSVVVPESTAIVTFKPGDRSMLVPGAPVTVTSQVRNGQPTALRAQVGRNGFVPPT